MALSHVSHSKSQTRGACYPKYFFLCQWQQYTQANPVIQAHFKPLLKSQPLKLIGKSKSHGKVQERGEEHTSHRKAMMRALIYDTNTRQRGLRIDNSITILNIRDHFLIQVCLILKLKFFQLFSHAEYGEG